MKRREFCTVFGALLVFCVFLPLGFVCSATTPQENITVPISLMKELKYNNEQILKEQEKSTKQFQKLEQLTNEQEKLISKQNELLQQAETQTKELENMLEQTNNYFNEYSRQMKNKQRKKNIIICVLTCCVLKQLV